MSILRDLLPLFKDLQQKSQAQAEAFRAIDDLVRQDGYSLYWDDCEQRYCIYPLPKTLKEITPLIQRVDHAPYPYCCPMHYPMPDKPMGGHK